MVLKKAFLYLHLAFQILPFVGTFQGIVFVVMIIVVFLCVFKLPITYIKDTNMSAAPVLKTSSTTSSFLDVSLSMKISSKGRREGASRAHFRRKKKTKKRNA